MLIDLCRLKKKKSSASQTKFERENGFKNNLTCLLEDKYISKSQMAKSNLKKKKIQHFSELGKTN